ncbi:hypothetical protein NIA69_17075 [Gemmiger formicilis]|nr:hypothetical protein [Gemmiger formicilis]
MVNPRDDVRLRRIINEPARKIGMTTIEKIGELAASKGVPMMEIIAHVRDYRNCSSAPRRSSASMRCTASCAICR